MGQISRPFSEAEMARQVLVTSALPYANGSIHLGHMVEYIQTDIYVRFLRLLGRKAIYICADDTHGTPIEVNARKAGVPPEEFVERYFHEHRRDFADFGIEFSSFSTTNSEENRLLCTLIFNRLRDKGYVYEKEIELSYCPRCRRFLPDRFIQGSCPRCGAPDQYGDVCESCNSTYQPTELRDARCVLCGGPPSLRSSRHYFFRLREFSGRLAGWLGSGERVQSEVRHFIQRWIDAGLEDWCISRDGPYFGFPIPGELNKYFYVWLDAPIGYISGTRIWCTESGESFDSWWHDTQSEIVHFIGKDIIYFHTLFWPAILMGADFDLPDRVVVHGFLTVNRQKMSKSRGTFLTARRYLEDLHPEYLRWFYAGSLGEGLTDIDLNEADFKARVNDELINNLVNFAYRTLSFTNRKLDGRAGTLPSGAEALIGEMEGKYAEIGRAYARVNFRQAVRLLSEAGDQANLYLQSREPWREIRASEEQARSTLTLCLNLCKNLSVLLSPILPGVAGEIRRQLGLEGPPSWDDLDFRFTGRRIGQEKVLLPRVEDDSLGALHGTAGG